MQILRGSVTLFLCFALCFPAPMGLAQPSPAPRAASQPGARAAYRSTQLQGDARILHALDRFTFGPRPGELDAVRAEGLDKWFDEQLQPRNVDETALYARLAQYPAMQLSVRDLMDRYPGDAMIRMVMNGRTSIPSDPIERAIYENAMYRVRQRQQGRAGQEPAGHNRDSMGRQSGRHARRQMNATPAMYESDAMAEPVKSAPGQASMDQPSPGRPSPDQPSPNQPTMGQTAQPPAMDDPTPMNGTAAEASRVDPDMIRAILALAPEQRVARLASIREPEFDDFIKSLRPVQRAALVAGLTPRQKETVEALAGAQRMVVQELMAERLICDIYSRAQVLEVMTDFWLNHFNVYLGKDPQMPYYLVSYGRDTIRPYALGRFENLLEAVAHSPAMLIYLDNTSSVGPHSIAAERFAMNAWRRPGKKHHDAPGINENYGRELMELHTISVNGGYTQADVIQASRVLTGWTVDKPQFGGGFIFNPNTHDPGTKVVMGHKIKQNGEKEGEELLHMLATQPSTAQFLSRQLAIRFVGDNPPQSLLDRMAKTYMKSGGNISAVLQTLFHSPEFWSDSNYGAKIKTPLEYVVSAARAGNADVTNFMPLVNALRTMGMPLYGCVQPNGYSWQSAAWVNTGDLADRMNFALAFASNRLPGIVTNWRPQPTTDDAATPSPAQEEVRLEPLLLPGGATATTRAAAIAEFEKRSAQQDSSSQTPRPARDQAIMRPVFAAQKSNRRPPPNAVEREDQLLAGLLIGSPDFQRR